MTEGIAIQRVGLANRREVEEFLDFPLSLYGHNAKTRNAIARTKQIVGAGSQHELYVARSGGAIVGRMAVGSNEELRDADGVPFGQIGLFEAIEDYRVFASMLDHARGLLDGKHRRVLFPFFVSTWYPYRFASKGLDAFEFFLENDSKEYYARFSAEYGVGEVALYRSYRNTVDDFLSKNRDAYERAVASGVTFRPFVRSDARNELRIAHELSTRIFSSNRLYSAIRFERFLDLYLPLVRILDSECFLFALNERREPVGLIFCSPDYTYLFNSADMQSLRGKIRFLRERKRARGLIVKSGGVLPEYRAKGIAGGLCYMQGLNAQRRGYQYVIVALVYSENPVSHITSSHRIEKEYELYTIGP